MVRKIAHAFTLCIALGNAYGMLEENDDHSRKSSQRQIKSNRPMRTCRSYGWYGMGPKSPQVSLHSGSNPFHLEETSNDEIENHKIVLEGFPHTHFSLLSLDRFLSPTWNLPNARTIIDELGNQVMLSSIPMTYQEKLYEKATILAGLCSHYMSRVYSKQTGNRYDLFFEIIPPTLEDIFNFTHVCINNPITLNILTDHKKSQLYTTINNESSPNARLKIHHAKAFLPEDGPTRLEFIFHEQADMLDYVTHFLGKICTRELIVGSIEMFVPVLSKIGKTMAEENITRSRKPVQEIHSDTDNNANKNNSDFNCNCKNAQLLPDSSPKVFSEESKDAEKPLDFCKKNDK